MNFEDYYANFRFFTYQARLPDRLIFGAGSKILLRQIRHHFPAWYQAMPNRSGTCQIKIRQQPDRSGCCLIKIRQLPDQSGTCHIKIRWQPDRSGSCLIKIRQLPDRSGPWFVRSLLECWIVRFWYSIYKKKLKKYLLMKLYHSFLFAYFIGRNKSCIIYTIKLCKNSLIKKKKEERKKIGLTLLHTNGLKKTQQNHINLN